MAPAVYRFGSFELIASQFELRRNGRVVKLERIPMELLVLLAERNGDVVTRAEIIDRLWGKDVFVDTEHGINTAVRKIRTALAEDADRPRFVRTVAGKGYRLVIDTPESAVAPAGAERSAISAEPLAVAVPPAPPAPPAPDSAALARPPRAPRTVLAAAVVGLILATAVIAWRRTAATTITSRQTIRSIAVLPLASLSTDRSQEYFADGITDELITVLAKNTSLRVISHVSVMQYKHPSRPLRDIARDLNVDSILEGSVSKSAAGVHLSLQLIEAATDTHLWADSYDRGVDEVYALSPSVAETIAKVAGAVTTAAAERAVNPDAHDAYLHGRYFWFAEDYDRSQEYLEKAIQTQPDYALAWSGLADVFAVRAIAGMRPPQEVIAQARAANRKALELDSTLAEAHNALGALHLFYDWNYQAADEETRRATELNPNFAEAHHLRSYVMTAMNRPDDALREQQRATELDPFARPWALGFAMMHLRQFEAAVAELRLRRVAQPRDVTTRLLLAECYAHTHMDRESVLELADVDRMSGHEEWAAGLLKAFEHGGARAVADYQLRITEARAKQTYVSALSLALAHARAGHREQALSFLEAAVKERSPRLIFLQASADFDSLHGDSRYEAVVQRVGLAPAAR